MLDVLLAATSAASLAILVVLSRSLTRICRRITLLEHQEKERNKALRLVLTPRGEPVREDLDGEVAPAEPERRRRHLALYRGGAAAAFIALGATAQAAWRANRPLSYTVAVATATTGIVAAVLVTNGDEGSNSQPAPPTPAPSATRTPGPTPSPTRSSPSPSPSSPAPARSGPVFSPRPAPPAVPSPNGGSTPVPLPSSELPAPAPPIPGPPTASPALPTLPPVPTPMVKPPGTDGRCVELNVPPLADVDMCLPNGR